ncbi:DEAD/DEAH box helicase [Agrococcus lahaulensis]|uniref:DEAD/DEAH box helicase n=1 Tax=Agrococcus lahaulensis TaxID=341722 RepID=UPI00047B7576|nr:helicase-related protein [Agrococcus lahaulensis]
MYRFGYHPIPDAVQDVLDRGTFARAIVIDEPVSELFDAVGSVRAATEPTPGLPSGLYWFDGIEQAIILQVGSGPAAASDELHVEAWHDCPEHPLVEAWRWAEHLWSSGADVPVPRFELRERVVTVPQGIDVEVRERTFDRGSWAYRVFGGGGTQVVLEHQLQRVEVTDDPDRWVLGERASAARFGATLTRTKLRGRFADTIYSFGATRTVFRPYQFKPVLKLLESGRARILIADEVGLGKTIEAGLIWTELEARHEADNVLIVCPSGLVDKWRDEMVERFGFSLTHLHRDELARYLEQHRSGRLPKRQAYVVSLEALRSWSALPELVENPPEFDLVIVDEAHAMRNSTTKSYELGTYLSEWTQGSNMVFLTATPINLRETDLLNLLGLLEPSDFQTLEDLEARLEPNAVLNQVARVLPQKDVTPRDFSELLSQFTGLVYEKTITMRPEFQELRDVVSSTPLAPKDIARARHLIAELNTLSTAVTRTRRAEVDERKALRDAEPGIEIVWSPLESTFYSEYLQWCQRRADLAGTPLYFSMQMPLRLASTSVHIAAQQVLRFDPETWTGDVDTPVSQSWVEPHPELVAAAKRVIEVPDTKLGRLGEVLEELRGLNRRALLFTWSKATLRYLQAHYRDQFRIAVLNGDVPREQRRRIMKEFRAGGYDFVFANRVASEGLDFEFCSAVINYDLPWNPMEVEQRIGRIDRIGQTSEKILIRNFYNDEAIDARIMYRVLQRIAIFERSIGELEPIIGQHMDALRSAMDFRLTRAQQEEKSQQFLTAVEAQRVGLQNVADSAAGLIISNTVDVAGLQDELISSGRYLGQPELAHLLEDWAQADGGDPLEWLDDGKSVEVRGNSAMAQRVQDLVQQGRRTRSEVGDLVSALHNGAPVHLAVDQETSRTSGVGLLSANHPLVMAATEVPGFRHARYAALRTLQSDDVTPGTYLVVLALAEHASRGGDEIWGAAVTLDGRAVEGPADAVLAALARGALQDATPVASDTLPRLARRAMRTLERKHREVSERREAEEEALTAARRVTLADQHERRMRGIARRMATSLERDRGSRIIRMIEGQRHRQQARYERLLAELDARKTPSMTLRYLAVCTLEVTQ